MTPQEIKFCIASRGISQKELARKLGVTSAAISLIISGKRRSNWIASHIAATIGLPMEAIWESYPKARKKQGHA